MRGAGVLPEDAGAPARLAARLRRHVVWARTQGVGRLVEEDRLDPRERLGDAYARWAWRRRHGQAPGSARAVFVLGVQRSGTNMLLRGLESAPEVEVHNENDRRVFTRFRLREDEVVRSTVAASQHRIVLFKPLCDSHRADHLLDGLGLLPAPRVVWPYRHVDGRVRSAVAKFGDVNRRVMAEVADGRAAGKWQAQRLPEATLELLREVRPAQLSPEDGAALFWYARNQLLLELGLHRRPDVLVVGYEATVADPDEVTSALCGFLDLPWTPRMSAHVDRRAVSAAQRVDLDPRVRAACDELAARLDAVSAEHLARPTGARTAP